MIPIYILAIESDHDRDFMTGLYLDYKGLIYREILARSGAETADDLVQETMIRLIDKVELLETLDEKRLTAYVAETAKNIAKNHLRKKEGRTVSVEELSELPDPTGTAEDRVLGSVDTSALKQVWGSLPEDVRSLLRMKYFLQMDNKEIAAHLGIKPESVRMRLTRARGRLLERMKAEEVRE